MKEGKTEKHIVLASDLRDVKVQLESGKSFAETGDIFLLLEKLTEQVFPGELLIEVKANAKKILDILKMEISTLEEEEEEKIISAEEWQSMEKCFNDLQASTADVPATQDALILAEIAQLSLHLLEQKQAGAKVIQAEALAVCKLSPQLPCDEKESELYSDEEEEDMDTSIGEQLLAQARKDIVDAYKTYRRNRTNRKPDLRADIERLIFLSEQMEEERGAMSGVEEKGVEIKPKKTVGFFEEQQLRVDGSVVCIPIPPL